MITTKTIHEKSQRFAAQNIDRRRTCAIDPTPEEIKQRTAEIRKTWSPGRWSQQRQELSQRWTVPEVKVSCPPI